MGSKIKSSIKSHYSIKKFINMDLPKIVKVGGVGGLRKKRSYVPDFGAVESKLNIGVVLADTKVYKKITWYTKLFDHTFISRLKENKLIQKRVFKLDLNFYKNR